MLLFFTLSCKKENFKTFEIEKSYTITDTLLKNKYIVPIQKAKVVKIKYEGKNNTVPVVYYLIQQSDGKYAMMGKSKNFANPAPINLQFGTNATAAIIDFSEASLLASIISDMGLELTREADHVYSFVKIIPEGFELEGNQYGDRLTLSPMDESLAEAKYILSGGVLKDYNAITTLYNKTAYQSVMLSGRPAQLVLDPITSMTWIYYSGEKNMEDITRLEKDGYRPTVSLAVAYEPSVTGDSILFSKEIAVADQLLRGFIWNSDRSALKLLVVSQGKTVNMNLTSSKIPAISYTELSTFLASKHQSKDYYNNNATADERDVSDIINYLNIPTNFKFDFDSLAKYPDYGTGWSQSMKDKALLLANKIKTLGSNVKNIKFESQALYSFREVFTDFNVDGHVGMSHDITISFSSDAGPDAMTYRQNVLAVENNPSVWLPPIAYYGFQNPSFMILKTPTKPANLVKIWSEFSNFFKGYENDPLQSNYLSPVKTNGPVRVNMVSKKTGDAFVGYCY